MKADTIEVYYPYGEESGLFTDTVIEEIRPLFSPLLGPDGHNLPYVYPEVGFNLRKKDER